MPIYALFSFNTGGLDFFFILPYTAFIFDTRRFKCPAEEKENCAKLPRTNARKNCGKTDTRINNGDHSNFKFWRLFTEPLNKSMKENKNHGGHVEPSVRVERSFDTIILLP